jgi:hypothetical protein
MVLQLHDQRVAAYREWEESFRQYLLDEQENIFNLAIQQATSEFQRISTELLAVQRESDAELAGLVKRLQEQEQQKLKLTALLQTLQKKHYIDDARRERDEAAAEKAERQGSKVLEYETPPGGGGEIKTLSDKRQPKANALYDREAGKAARGLAEVIEEINDIVAEIRYM